MRTLNIQNTGNCNGSDSLLCAAHSNATNSGQPPALTAIQDFSVFLLRGLQAEQFFMRPNN
jgi:hypothetical protein